MVLRHSSNYTSLLQNTDSNAIYVVQKTVPCYYSSHHLEHAMQKVGSVNFGKIIGLIVLHFFTLPVAASIGYLLLLSSTFLGKPVYDAMLAHTPAPKMWMKRSPQ